MNIPNSLYQRSVPLQKPEAIHIAGLYIRMLPPTEGVRVEMPRVIVAKGDIDGFGRWSLDDQGLLVIEGHGKMPSMSYGAPWRSYWKDICHASISDRVTSIGKLAFFECRNLKDVNIPSSVRQIGDSAFCRCGKLCNIYLHLGLTRIGENAFSDCNSLTHIDIPDTVNHIGGNVFMGCSHLESVTMPERFDCASLAFWWKYGISKSKVSFTPKIFSFNYDYDKLFPFDYD